MRMGPSRSQPTSSKEVPTDGDDKWARTWRGPDDPPQGEKSRYTMKLNSFPPNENVYLKSRNISDQLVQNLSAVSLDLLEIAANIYSGDQSKTCGGSTIPQDGRNWHRQFELSISVRRSSIWNERRVSEKLTELLRFMANDDYRFVFRSLVGDYRRDSYFEFDRGQPWFEPDSTQLASRDDCSQAWSWETSC